MSNVHEVRQALLDRILETVDDEGLARASSGDIRQWAESYATLRPLIAVDGEGKLVPHD